MENLRETKKKEAGRGILLFLTFIRPSDTRGLPRIVHSSYSRRGSTKTAIVSPLSLIKFPSYTRRKTGKDRRNEGAVYRTAGVQLVQKKKRKKKNIYNY